MPHVTIFADNGPLAGDLAACLSGKFAIDRVMNQQQALDTLAGGCRAMLILKGHQEEFGPARVELIRKAVAEHCRVLVLGPGGLSLAPELDTSVIHLPPSPSPSDLLATLADLEPGPHSSLS